jgi:pimeloyl-ACP methyl ester carboxylesterase
MRFLVVLYTLAFTLLTVNARADLPKACSRKDVYTTSVPLDYDNPKSEKIEYRYQLFEASVPGAPTIVFVPGGPGAASIADWDSEIYAGEFKSYGYSKNFNILFVDPRGVGCNSEKSEAVFKNTVSTEVLALDTLAAVRDAKVSDYVIYGQSYGSMWATVLAAKAELDGGPKPKAVLISGVIGHGLKGTGNSYTHGVMAQWARIKEKLDPRIPELLKQENPLGVEDSKWRWFIQIGIYRGAWTHSAGFSYRLFDDLNLAISTDPKDLEKLKDLLNESTSSTPLDEEFSEPLFGAVACAEITDTAPDGMFSKGEIIEKPNTDPCTKGQLSRAFDAGNYKIRSPIYYLSGSLDPSTSFENARYHFENSRYSKRYFLTVPEGGHNPVGYVLPDCVESFWSSLRKASESSLRATLKKCQAPLKLEVRKAEKW